jgi:hypothetical protein
VERGFTPFKEALQKGMAKKGRNNWLFGVFVVNIEINDVPLENHGNFFLCLGRDEVAFTFLDIAT